MSTMNKPLIALDLDGVLALENRSEYYQAKAEGVSALRNYYLSLKPNTQLINNLIDINTMFEYRIFTARKSDLPDIKSITVDWVFKYCRHLNGNAWPPDITFTKFRWKAPEVYFWGAKALIDNDIDNLSAVPFIKRYGYNIYLPNNYPLMPRFYTEFWDLHDSDLLTIQIVKDFYEKRS